MIKFRDQDGKLIATLNDNDEQPQFVEGKNYKDVVDIEKEENESDDK